ncbi:MAG: hypothetical protein BIFFINMI_02974 [Phycisphaerae bacterium]|nr:hypothetical protein [Phycisphaerae bacterium]
MRQSRQRAAAGFTLVELMIAVGLLAMIFVVAGYIFQTSVTAIGQAQASNEMVMSLAAFDKVIRQDLAAIEPGGFLGMGRREQDGYGTGMDSAQGLKKKYRKDWMMFYITTERCSPMDPRAIGQWARVFYGPGQTADPNDSGASDLVSNWVLMRHQVLLCPKLRMDKNAIEATSGPSGWSDPVGPFLGIEWPQEGDYPGMERSYWRATDTYRFRRMHWWWYWNYGWCGTVSTPWVYDRVSRTNPEKPQRAYSEPDFYHNVPGLGGGLKVNFSALGHCDFKVQYAMKEDLGTTIAWRDPPAVGGSGNPADPNYNASDPVHNTSQTNQDGRLMFTPGDRWPALLKITVRVFDPLARLVDGRTMDVIMMLP